MPTYWNRVAFLLLLFVLAEPCLAARKIIVSPCFRSYTGRCNTGATCNLFMRLVGYFTNLSSLPQNIELKLVSGTVVNSGSTTSSAYLAVCADNDTNTGSFDPKSATIPVPSSASILALSGSATKKVTIELQTTFTQGSTSNFAPALEIKVLQDKGAVIATFVPYLDSHGSPGTTTTGTRCNGTTFTLNGTNNLPEERTNTPFLVNGGRPF